MPDNLPPDPLELSYEEVEERLTLVSDDLRPLVREMWLTAPQTQVNAHTLTDMPSAGALFAAIQALTEDEVRRVLHGYLFEYHRLKLTPEEFGRWTVPDFRDDE